MPAETDDSVLPSVLALAECDIVMKGGVTSGVVYPGAVVELSKRYRFKNIGGTSAGAIAAVVTAAAEFGRESGGFDKVSALPDELSTSLLRKFQPLPQYRPLFSLMLAIQNGGRLAILLAFFSGFSLAALVGAAPGFAVLLFAGLLNESRGFVLLGLLLAVLGAFAFPAWRIWRLVTRGLPATDFGICNGLTQKCEGEPALTDWLTDTIDRVAGRALGSPPLNLADLEEAEIGLQTVTTDLSTHRPYALPMKNNLHFFRESEFLKLFPKRVVEHMKATSRKAEGDEFIAKGGDFWYFENARMPVVVLARMSLSFPGLISAVPLWRHDYTLRFPDEDGRLVRCLFSDGGVSSNFPVHFFDRFLPATPTFGISLGTHDSRREGERRVVLPLEAGSGRLLPVRGIYGLGSFVMALFNSAKDWQDSLQSILPGYRERIVTINLTDKEGGMNLDMAAEKIRFLTGLGKEAGLEIVSEFNPDEHRWRRYLVELNALDEMLRGFAKAWDMPGHAGQMSFPELAIEHKPESFKELSTTQRASLRDRAELIATLGRALETMTPTVESMRRRIPQSHSSLRSIARMEE